MELTCRFYEKKSPNIGDVVMVRIHSFPVEGAGVHLLEYNNMEGFVQLKALLPHKKFPKPNRDFSWNKGKVGQIEPMMVITNNYKGKKPSPQRLSRKCVTPVDRQRCTEAYSKAKAVDSVLRHVASKLNYKSNEEFEALYSKTAWCPMVKGSSYDYFERVALNPSLLEKCDLDEETKSILLKTIKTKLTQQAVKIRADIKASCKKHEGINSVKDALKTGMTCGTEEMPIKINLMARGIPRKPSPLCVVTTSTPERQDGLKSLNDACHTNQNTINAAGGTFNYKTVPKVVTATTEAELAKQLAQAKFENADVFGDDDDDEQDCFFFRDEAEEVRHEAQGAPNELPQVLGEVPDHWDNE